MRLASVFSVVKTSAIRNPNGANGMNTPCWEAGGWTALVGGNPTERIGRSRVNDMAGWGGITTRAECCSARVRREVPRYKSEIIHPTSCSKTRTTNSEPAQWTGRTAEIISAIRSRNPRSCYVGPMTMAGMSAQRGFMHEQEYALRYNATRASDQRCSPNADANCRLLYRTPAARGFGTCAACC
jgi:hypothetical protein